MNSSLRALLLAASRRRRVKGAVEHLLQQSFTQQRFLCQIPSLTGMPQPFTYKETLFNSAIVNAGKVNVEDTAEFATTLYSTITHLRHEKKNAMWLKIPLDFAHYISTANSFGFQLHHIFEQNVVMALWLRFDVPNKIPPFSTHHVGVAGIVLDSESNVLVVKEKRPNAIWKFPGGLSNMEENIGDAAVREIYEETGVKTEFDSVIAFRQQHKMQFGCSDLYFACLMKELREQVPVIPCTYEIDDIRWMPLDEFDNQNTNTMIAAIVSTIRKVDGTLALKPERHDSTVPDRPPFLLYYPH